MASPQSIREGISYGMRAVPAKALVNFQKAVNQMQDVLASIRTSSCCAKMGTATEGAVFIDEAPG